MTPRLVGLCLAGAAQRSRRLRADMAEAVFVGTHADAKELSAYQDQVLAAQPATPLPPEALDGMLRKFSARLPGAPQNSQVQ